MIPDSLHSCLITMKPPAQRPVQSVVAITGASGFVGAACARTLLGRSAIELRALSRNEAFCNTKLDASFVTIRGDLASAPALDEFLRPGCSVVNFAYDGSASAERNLAAATALAEGCIRNQVRRVVHCSTAVVVGRTHRAVIDERVECRPQTAYERTKLAIEDVFRHAARGNFELAILRPTAVFGPGGRNLMKLADDLARGPRFLNLLRSFANGYRRLNLVAVENVVAAAVHLLDANEVDGQTFIVSDDDDPLNNFHDVERNLLRVFALRDHSIEAALPAPVLELALRLKGRSLTNPQTRFCVEKLAATGFKKPVKFASALNAFAAWYKHTHTVPARPH